MPDPKPPDVTRELEPTPPPSPNPLEKVIFPDWGKKIEELTNKLDALFTEKEEIKAKHAELMQELQSFRASAPQHVQKRINKEFAAWDIFFENFWI